jgi:hypothetical protein
MKKLLLKSILLLCALITGTSAWATDLTLDLSSNTGWTITNAGTSGTGSAVEMSKDGITINASKGYWEGSQLRVYKGSTFVVTSSIGNMSQIALTFTGDKTGPLSGYSGGTATVSPAATSYNSSASGQARIVQIVVTYTVPAAAVATPTFSVAAGTYTSTKSVELACATGGATIYYTLDGSTPTDGSTEYTGTAISVSETKTIKAIAKKGSDYSNVASATYTIYPVLHAGTALDPYTVADARNAIDANTGLTDVYVSGIVCEGGSELTSGAMNYWISDDGTETNKFEIYRGKGISGADFSAISDVKEGDAVVVTGTIKKFGTVYEFQTGSQLVSLVPSANPLISVTPTSLTGFTYGVGSGPSDAQTFSVEGSNLTENISLSLGESNYEMSLTEGGSYTNSLTLTQTAGSVAATTIYVRLKAGLAVNASYEGTVTLTSTGATGKAVSLAGSVTQPNFTWDLSTNSYDESPTENQVIWTSSYATMTNDKGSSSTDANNYIGGANSRTSTRFYGNQILTITPASGYAITSIVFTANSENYANALKNNSTWSNATAAASTTTVTVTPTNGALPISATIGATCGFTAVKVYYGVATSVTLTPAKEYTTLTSSHNLDFTNVSGLKAFIATEVSGGAVQMTQVNKVPAGTGLVLKATTPGTAVNVPVFDGTSPDDVSGNKMAGSATETTDIAANGGYILSDGKFHPASAGTLAAGKAYLNISVNARELELSFNESDVTAISEVTNTNRTNNTNVYDLQGRKVAQPTKGLYIVNGRKVIIK